MDLRGIFSSLMATIFWLNIKLLTTFFVVIGIAIIWRACKIALIRRVEFSRQLLVKPADARKVVLITGASSGIGLAVAKHLYKVGYSIIATYYDSQDPGMAELKQLAQQKNSTGAKKFFIHQLDQTKEDQVSRLCEQVSKQLNEHKLELYGLINNAGLGSLQPFAWLRRNIISNLIRTNITGALLMTREFVPLLAKCTGGARLLFVSSALAFVPGPKYATYGVTKTSHMYFSRSMNLELKEAYGIQSVAVIPHNFIKNTNIGTNVIRDQQAAWDELTPSERELHKPEYEQQLQLAMILERATKVHKKLSTEAEKRGKNEHQKMSVFSKKFLLHAFKSVTVFFGNIGACLRGENRSVSLEESGVPECFEEALRLKDPPELIFAGDTYFQTVYAAIFSLLSSTLMSSLGSRIMPSLYG